METITMRWTPKWNN